MINTAVLGMFTSREQAETAVEDMKRNGFRNNDISILFSYNRTAQDYVLEKTTDQSDAAAAHGVSCAEIGGALGWLAGIEVLLIPGLGSFMAAGPIREFFADSHKLAVGGL